MTSRSETLLSSQTHSGDSTTLTVVSDKLQGDGYYGRSDGLHTVQHTVSGITGTLSIQATLAVNPSESDWFTALSFVFDDKTETAINSFTGNYVWIRAKLEYTGGTLSNIILNH